MVREVVHDVLFLGQKSEPATQADKQVAIDLLDTLKAHEEGCVGMAANMIGVRKRIIAVNMGFMNVAMFNPRIVTYQKHLYHRYDAPTSPPLIRDSSL